MQERKIPLDSAFVPF